MGLDGGRVPAGEYFLHPLDEILGRATRGQRADPHWVALDPFDEAPGGGAAEVRE